MNTNKCREVTEDTHELLEEECSRLVLSQFGCSSDDGHNHCMQHVRKVKQVRQASLNDKYKAEMSGGSKEILTNLCHISSVSIQSQSHQRVNVPTNQTRDLSLLLLATKLQHKLQVRRANVAVRLLGHF